MFTRRVVMAATLAGLVTSEATHAVKISALMAPKALATSKSTTEIEDLLDLTPRINGKGRSYSDDDLITKVTQFTQSPNPEALRCVAVNADAAQETFQRRFVQLPMSSQSVATRRMHDIMVALKPALLEAPFAISEMPDADLVSDFVWLIVGEYVLSEAERQLHGDDAADIIEDQEIWVSNNEDEEISGIPADESVKEDEKSVIDGVPVSAGAMRRYAGPIAKCAFGSCIIGACSAMLLGDYLLSKDSDYYKVEDGAIINFTGPFGHEHSLENPLHLNERQSDMAGKVALAAWGFYKGSKIATEGRLGLNEEYSKDKARVQAFLMTKSNQLWSKADHAVRSLFSTAQNTAAARPESASFTQGKTSRRTKSGKRGPKKQPQLRGHSKKRWH